MAPGGFFRGETVTASSFNSKPFSSMGGAEKFKFGAQLVVFLCTFGFAFPTLLHSDEYVRTFT
jgi:hypothetical protein